MKKVTFIPLIVALVLFLGILFVPNKWLAYFISDAKITQAGSALNPLMFQGAYMQQQLFEQDNTLPIIGSSELNRFDPFHPYNYAQAENTAYEPVLIGRGGMQSITHFLNFATQQHSLKDKKMMIIVSPQWFTPKGMDEFHFSPNYSMLQAYQLAFNDEMDADLRKRAMTRLLQFDTIKRDYVLKTLYEYELADGKDNKIKGNLAKIAGRTNLALLEKKDLYYALLPNPMRNHQENKNLIVGKSFEQQLASAEQYGAKRTSNTLMIDDSTYNSTIEPRLARLKNFRKKEQYTNSPEYGDFQLMLDMLKDAGAKPLFVSIPVNGKWYDYGGFPKERREAYYKKMRQTLEASGFPYVDYSDHEYDPYFIKDTIHIAWKGWVYFDRDMTKFWAQ